MIALDEAVTLYAPGGAHLPAHETLVVADVHAGYVADLQRRGYGLPDGDDRALHDRLQRLLDATDPAHVVVAGDLVHGPAAAHPGPATAPLDQLLDLLRGRRITVVLGNHDEAVAGALLARGVETVSRLEVGPHTVVHGDEDTDTLRAARDEALGRGGRLMIGHVHPALNLADGMGARGRAAAFVSAPGFLALPALSPLARGSNLYVVEYAEALTRLVDAAALQVAVVVGAEVIPTGSLAALWKLQGVRPKTTNPAAAPKRGRGRRA